MAVSAHYQISIIELWPVREKKSNFFVKDDVSSLEYARVNDMPIQTFAFPNYWVALRRTYVFTLQEVEKICRTLQSHVMQVWTMTFWLLAPNPDKAEPLPVLSSKLQVDPI